MENERWEKVHAIHDYHDGPVSGVADLDGTPHVFEQIFNEEMDEYSDRYRVMEIDQELHSRITEAWAIFVRWRAAFDDGKTTVKTHPAQSEDRERYLELEQAIASRRKPHPDRSTVVGRGSGRSIRVDRMFWGSGKWSGWFSPVALNPLEIPGKIPTFRATFET